MRVSLVPQALMNPPAIRGDLGSSLGWESPGGVHGSLLFSSLEDPHGQI